MLSTASSFPVRNGKGYQNSRERDGHNRNRVSSVHGIASPNLHASVRAAAIAARQVRQIRSKRVLDTILDNKEDGGTVDVGEASFVKPVFDPTAKRKMRLHLSLDKLEQPALPWMTSPGIESQTDYNRASIDLVSYESTPLQTEPSHRSRRASSITLSMNSPEAADFNEVAYDGPEDLGKWTKRVKKLGKGAGGTVFLSLYMPTFKLVAVKEVFVFQEVDRHMVKRELHTLHENLASIDDRDDLRSSADMLQHHFKRARYLLCPYLVTFYGAFLKPAQCAVSVVMEFMDMGSLQDLIDAKVTMSEEVLRHAAFCCITALDHLHSQRTAHRDIKPANILMNRNGDFKIADFGLASTLAKSNSFFSDFTGTIMYMAPERISGAYYSFVSDIWSLGITLFSLATGGYPFTVDDGFFGLEEAICHDPLHPIPNRFSPICRDFIKRMLNRDPERRITSEEALTHPFISGYGHSMAIRKFSRLWQSLGLTRLVGPKDAEAIASLVVEYSYRHPDIIKLPYEVTNIETSPLLPMERHSFFHLFAKHLKQEHKSSSRTPFEQLADDCGVSIETLQTIFRSVLNL